MFSHLGPGEKSISWLDTFQSVNPFKHKSCWKAAKRMPKLWRKLWFAMIGAIASRQSSLKRYSGSNDAMSCFRGNWIVERFRCRYSFSCNSSSHGTGKAARKSNTWYSASRCNRRTRRTSEMSLVTIEVKIDPNKIVSPVAKSATTRSDWRWSSMFSDMREGGIRESAHSKLVMYLAWKSMRSVSESTQPPCCPTKNQRQVNMCRKRQSIRPASRRFNTARISRLVCTKVKCRYLDRPAMTNSLGNCSNRRSCTLRRNAEFAPRSTSTHWVVMRRTSNRAKRSTRRQVSVADQAIVAERGMLKNAKVVIERSVANAYFPSKAIRGQRTTSRRITERKTPAQICTQGPVHLFFWDTATR
mmetsp:Transcript_36625/g.85909  ORF Transcript_36625/g.85909 Transcript_36625/m.85909 type:complete len:358 (-) Transcript_36625:516-1589(-)